MMTFCQEYWPAQVLFWCESMTQRMSHGRVENSIQERRVGYVCGNGCKNIRCIRVPVLFVSRVVCQNIFPLHTDMSTPGG